jgi:hypothetical protein
MTAIAETSRESFRKLNPTKTAKERLTILAVFTSNPTRIFSDRALSKETKLPINVVESRRNDLDKKYQKIESAGLTYDFETKRRVQAWRLRR